MNMYSGIPEEQEQLDELSVLLKRIKIKIRKNRANGEVVPDELLFLIKRLNRQEIEIWCNIRKMWVADDEDRKMLQKAIHSRMDHFRKSCAQAMALFPLG